MNISNIAFVSFHIYKIVQPLILSNITLHIQSANLFAINYPIFVIKPRLNSPIGLIINSYYKKMGEII